MKTFNLILGFIFSTIYCTAQTEIVAGVVKNARDKSPIEGAKIWNNDNPEELEISQQGGKFELHTTGKRVLIYCEKEGFGRFGERVTLPDYNMDIFLEPETPETVELMITIEDENTKEPLDSIDFFYHNINGYDCYSVNKRQIFKIPIYLIKLNNNSLLLNISKKGYKTINPEILFNEDDKSKKFKNVEYFLQSLKKPDTLKPPGEKNDSEPRATWPSVLVHGFVQLHNKETGKGFVLLASEIILIPSFLVFENLRSS